jgi:quercetin dioxygenase-like cupin family protein/uncharacterized protein (DUF2249 family)
LALLPEGLTHVKARPAPGGYIATMNERPLIDSGREKIVSLLTETQYAPNGIVSRTLLRTANSRMVLFGFSEGQELTEHTSTQEAIIQILSGECEFSVAGQPHPMKTGDLLYMPANCAHAVKATKQFSMLLTLLKPSPLAGNGLPVQPAKAACECERANPGEAVEVDARGLEPPQPLVKILESLGTLTPGGRLRARTDRRPMHLYSQLEERGFTGETEEQPDGSFLTQIRPR